MLRVLGDALAQDVARAGERVVHRRHFALGAHEARRGGRGRCVVERAGPERVGQRLEPALARDRRARAALRLVRQVEVLERLLRRHGVELRRQLGRELALLLDGLADGRAAVGQLAQVLGALLDGAELRLVEPARGLLAIAGDERKRVALVEQGEGAGDVAWRERELGGDGGGELRERGGEDDGMLSCGTVKRGAEDARREEQGDRARQQGNGLTDRHAPCDAELDNHEPGARMSARRSFIFLAAALAVSACSHKDNSTADSAAGAVSADSSTLNHPLSVTPAEGGAAQVTATDGKSVNRATEYELTDQNFNQFVKASDSLAALRQRDSTVRATLDEQISDAGNGTRVSATDAGIKHLESNAVVNNAIVSTGMSVPDYFVASIAIAQAERFLDNPKAAPPTPALGKNIEFLQAHRAQLQAMRTRDSSH